MMSLRALVIGGGFSGMSAAIELQKRGIAVDLVEIDSGWRSYGAGISLGGATLRAFRTLGILDDFLDCSWGSDGVDLCSPDGDVVSQLPTPRIAGPDVPGGAGTMRPVLARLMGDATRRAGVDVRLGCSFTEINQDAEGVDVSFSDGTTARYDLVVAADGLYSPTRAWMYPDAPGPAYTGQGVWRAVLPRPVDLVRCTMWMGGTVKPGVNPVSHEEMYLFVTETRPRNEHIPAESQPEALRALLEQYRAPVLRQACERIDADAQVIFRPLESLLLREPWFKGRVVLIGDAVHATTPHLASGTCIGIEDGLVLAEELGTASNVEAALVAFTRRRWDRCRMVVENSGQLGEIERTNGDKREHGRVMRESMMALAEPI